MATSITTSRQKAFTRQAGRCFYCGIKMWASNPDNFTIEYGISERLVARIQCTAEHLLARMDGGSNHSENIAAACRFCNQARHRMKTAPSAQGFRQHVQARIKKGRWHPLDLYQAGLCSVSV